MEGEVLGLLAARLGHGWRHVGRRLVQETHDTEFIPAIWTATTPKNGVGVMDAGVAIYWDEFSEVDQSIVADQPRGKTRLRRWAMPCITRSFASLDSRWSDGMHLVDEASAVANKLMLAYEAVGREFLVSVATAEGILDYLQSHSDAPGTWRITLEFLIVRKLRGATVACDLLRSKAPRTIWEERQKQWLLREMCLRTQ
jgi:hypothetical protein